MKKPMKTRVLISFAFTPKLICVFVFAYAKCWFTHDAVHISIGVFYVCFLSIFRLNNAKIEKSIQRTTERKKERANEAR